jgi:hypothetical protein
MELMSKDLTLDTDLITIQESIIGDSIQEREFLRAVKNSSIPAIEEILKNKDRHKNIIDNKGEVNARYLNAVFYVLSGKTGHDYLTLGEYIYYADEKKKWFELGGYENRYDFIKNTPNFPHSNSFCTNAKQAYKLVLHSRLKREDIILLGSKISLLADYITKDLTDNQLMKLIKKIVKMTADEIRKFIRNGDYLYFLDGETPPGETKTIPLTKTGKTHEYIQINLKMPKIHNERDKNGWYSYFDFEENWEQEVWSLAYQRRKKDIYEEVQSILNEPGFEKYQKLAKKKYKQG